MPIISRQVNMKTGDSLYYSIEASSALTAEKYVSLQNIKRVLDRNTIHPRFRIFALNQDETIWYRIPNEDIVLGGSYNENYQNGSRRTLSFSVYNDSGKYNPSPDNLWVGSKVRLDIGLEIPDESTTIWFNRGVFVMNTPSISKSADNKTVAFDCVDKFSLFGDKTGVLNSTLEVPVGTDIESLIKDTIAYDNGNGYPLDPKPIFYHPSFKGRKTPMKLSLSAGDTIESLLNQISEILSAEMFYDTNGTLVFVPIVEVMSDGDKPVLYDYDISNIQSEDFSFDMSSFVNCIQVVGGNINGHTCSAAAKNDDPMSPVSVQKIGLRTSVITDTNITTDIIAQERADYELRKAIVAKSTLSSTAFFNPLLSVNNLVTYTDKFFNLRRDRFLIQSIGFSLGYEGTMSLSVSNINNLPFIR